MLHLQLQLQLGARGGCDVIELCVFGKHLTDGLTVSVGIWRLGPLITVRDLQLVGMSSFTRYFAKMTSIYFISISSCQNVLPIYNRVYKIIFVPRGVTIHRCIGESYRNCQRYANRIVSGWIDSHDISSGGRNQAIKCP